MGMCTIQEARKVLMGAEVSLRELMEQGLGQHRYTDVAVIAGMAEGVSRLLLGDRARPPVQPTPPNVATETRSPRKTAKKARSRTQKREYPRFERDGDKLVKVGWSKKHKEQYEHRAPREAVIAFARHLAGHARDGEVFAMEDLLPVPDLSGGEVPAYQVYLTLAWLRQADAVEKKGRDGYVLRDRSLAEGGLDKLWNAVAQRSA